MAAPLPCYKKPRSIKNKEALAHPEALDLRVKTCPNFNHEPRFGTIPSTR